jgi:hypothetical protein
VLTSLHDQPRRQHAAVDVDRQSRERLRAECVGSGHENQVVDLIELEFAKRAETARQRPSTRHALQSRDAKVDRSFDSRRVCRREQWNIRRR